MSTESDSESRRRIREKQEYLSKRIGKPGFDHNGVFQIELWHRHLDSQDGRGPDPERVRQGKEAWDQMFGK